VLLLGPVVVPGQQIERRRRRHFQVGIAQQGTVRGDAVAAFTRGLVISAPSRRSLPHTVANASTQLAGHASPVDAFAQYRRSCSVPVDGPGPILRTRTYT
jgi:hypothetical protein